MSNEATPEDLGAKTGSVPVFSEYLEGSPLARSPEVPAHYTNEPRARDEGDTWAMGPDGTRMWGRFGAAGLLTLDRGRGVLMQHRALWSHHGGTWGIPGGALNKDESALDAAVREATEEALVPPDALDPLFSRVVDLGYWSYTTFVVETTRSFEAQITDDESAGLAWVIPKELQRLKLHPGFADSWTTLEPMLRYRPLIVADVANIVGTKPDGWWKDRAKAARRTIESIAAVAENGVPGSVFGIDADTSWPSLTCVVEGRARDIMREHAPLPRRVEVVAAEGSGDDWVVKVVAAARNANADTPILVATSDRELQQRVEEYGAHTIGARAFRDLAQQSTDEGK